MNSRNLKGVLRLNISDYMKPIITMSFSGVIMKDTPWKKAHEVWFEHYAKKLNKPEIVSYAKKEDWFNYVDEIMVLLEPDKSDSERTIIAREKYFDIICDFGCDDPSLENKETIAYLYSIKEKFSLGLITTTPQKTIEKILKVLGREKLFDFIECSLIEEKDDKLAVFKRYIEKNGKPKFFVGGERKGVIEFCKENDINFVSVDFQEEKELIEVLKKISTPN